VSTTGITQYHACYYAHELTRRCPSDSLQKLVATLADAQVDLNPHQIDAALFAFRSPLSKGAILADEVGLGKTIEAAILLSQKWAERKRKLLVIVPANLRKQWNQELADKFFLPSAILETRTFNEQIKQGNLNPFDQDEIIICSYHFARNKDAYIRQVNWHLVVIDEAHRLRNVYKPTNRIANAIKNAVAPFPKVLLTATPLQNSLLELFGLVSVVDDYTFGDLKSFKAQFASLTTDKDFADLKARLKPICQRTLRRQVLEYVPFTNRKAIVQEFFPTPEEQKLYDLVSDYLQRPNLFALPASQRQLMTLILRKLLASSTFAISATLGALSTKLETVAAAQAPVEILPEEVAPDYETLNETEDEWTDEDAPEKDERHYSPEELQQMSAEVADLKNFQSLARSIIKNSKGEVLLTALQRGFVAATEKGAQKKAIIFTESTRTQEYLRILLEQTEYTGKIVLFNGSNTDLKSKEIYRAWLKRHEGTDRVTGSPSADMRAALVDYFRDEAIVMIATEAAAEGINLQFCSLVLNYDLPWNPQRIEQRIGRCHRYGQKCDVVVVNFLNKSNAADVRVYQLLDEKFKLFNGVFEASDEVLGAIESGVDFEKRIIQIYQTCRTPEQIEFNFNALQKELETQIDEKIQQTRQKLLENFDEEVQEKLRIKDRESSEYLGKFQNWLWHGLEYNKWSALPPAHYASLPFTRYLAGHGDFTVCTLRPDSMKGTRVGLQLAAAVVFTSPIMHWADTPSLYLRSPAIDLIRSIPPVWDETRVLTGSEIGKVAAFARRSGDIWFVGIINAGDGFRYKLDLDFLGPLDHDALLASDHPDRPDELLVTRGHFNRNETLTVELKSAGGFVGRFTERSASSGNAERLR
jgi:ERCC4-related helicase